MGVGGFWTFLRSHAAGCFSYDDECRLRLAGFRFCVDGNMLLTSALKTTMTLDQEEVWIPVFTGVVLNKIAMIFDMTGRMPLVVVDGAHVECKSHAHEQRAKARAAAEKRFKDCTAAGDAEGALRARRAACRVTPSQEALVMEALVAAGVEVRRAPGEAENYCAQLCQRGETWGVVGDDGDTLICGAPWLLRGICQGGRLCLVSRDLLLRELDVGPKQLRWLAALSGSDFHPGVPQVGPARARKLVLLHPDPGASLSSLVKDGSLHEGLRLAARQFGDWDVSPPEEGGEVAATLRALQRVVVATAAERGGRRGGVDWDRAAASVASVVGREASAVLREMGHRRSAETAFGAGVALIE